MDAAAVMRQQPRAARLRPRWMMPLVVLICLCTTLVFPHSPRTWNISLSKTLSDPIVVKTVGPLSPRLAALAQVVWPPDDRSAYARALSLPESGPGSLLIDAIGNPLVYIWLSNTAPRTLTTLTAAGARVVHVSDRYHVVTAAIAPQRLKAVASVPGVVALQEALTPESREYSSSGRIHAATTADQKAATNCPSGAIVSDGDTQLRAATARKRFGVDGKGVTVGVLSGSYNVERATGIKAENDIASGDLPGPGNPCGYTTPVQVVAESRIGAGRDEGRAMLQIVHDMAPGAALAFANASDGLYAFADNIRRLRSEARADVMVDDYYYIEEPFFQDSPINIAIHEVTQDGALYVTAGGNIHVQDAAGHPIGSYETPAYRPTACPTLTDPSGNSLAPGIDCHDFDPSVATDARLAMTLPVSGVLLLNFQWSEPWFGVSTDLDIYLVDEHNKILAQSINGLGASPSENFGYSNTTSAPQTVYLVVARVSGGTPRFKFTTASAAITLPTISHMAYADVRSNDIFGPTVTDHSLDADAITVAADLYTDARHVAPFSSHGPAIVYWAPIESIRAAAALPQPAIRAKPDIVATTGVRTTFYGRDSLHAPRCAPADPKNAICRFFGTSASAPHVAGILALVKQRATQRDVPLVQAQAKSVLIRTAQQMRGTPDATGAGLIDATNAVAAVATLPNRPVLAPARVQMPALVGFTEQQAREALLQLGIPATQIVSDYQDRAKLGDLFDRTPPFHVVSTLPRAGELVDIGQVVVLGVRAPDPVKPSS